MIRSINLARAAGLAIALATSGPAWGIYPDPFPSPDPDPAPAPDIRALTLAGKGGSYLGIGVAEITSERAGELNLRDEHGVEVTRVEDDSPAAKGGLKAGDVVLDYNGQRVEGVAQFMRLVRETPPGRDVRLDVFRAGSPQQLTVRTGARKNFMAKLGDNTIVLPRVELRDIRIPDVPRAIMSWRNSQLGIDGESLDQQLAEYFGVKEGVLVRSVIKDSAADKAGLRAGDVIVKVDDTAVATPREVTNALRAARSGNTVNVQVIRERREASFNIPLEGNASGLGFSPRAGRK